MNWLFDSFTAPQQQIEIGLFKCVTSAAGFPAKLDQTSERGAEGSSWRLSGMQGNVHGMKAPKCTEDWAGGEKFVYRFRSFMYKADWQEEALSEFWCPPHQS